MVVQRKQRFDIVFEKDPAVVVIRKIVGNLPVGSRITEYEFKDVHLN